MTAPLIPWRSCTVETYRFQGIGIVRSSDPAMLDFVRRCGVTDDRDGHRFVLTSCPGGLRRIDPVQIDWTGLDEALATGKAA